MGSARAGERPRRGTPQGKNWTRTSPQGWRPPCGIWWARSPWALTHRRDGTRATPPASRTSRPPSRAPPACRRRSAGCLLCGAAPRRWGTLGRLTPRPAALRRRRRGLRRRAAAHPHRLESAAARAGRPAPRRPHRARRGLPAPALVPSRHSGRRGGRPPELRRQRRRGCPQWRGHSGCRPLAPCRRPLRRRRRRRNQSAHRPGPRAGQGGPLVRQTDRAGHRRCPHPTMPSGSASTSGVAASSELLSGLSGAVADLIDAKAGYDAGRGQRVAAYARAVAATLGMNPQRVELIDLAALRNDVGTLGVPSRILFKPSLLSIEEMERPGCAGWPASRAPGRQGLPGDPGWG